jgi:PilZ domain
LSKAVRVFAKGASFRLEHEMTFKLLELSFVDYATATLEDRRVDYATASLEDRSARRYKFEIAARLRPTGVTSFRVIVNNLSLSGFACEAVSGIPLGGRCWLSLPGLAPLQAEVIRNDGQVVGCAFTNLLSQIVLDAIIKQHGIALPQF